jgi:hypothetical protein
MSKKPKKAPETVVFTFRLPKQMLEDIRQDAKGDQRTIAGQIVHKLRTFYDE